MSDYNNNGGNERKQPAAPSHLWKHTWTMSGDDKNNSVVIGSWNGNIFLEFSKKIPNDKPIRVRMYMGMEKTHELFNLIQGIWAFRLDEYRKNGTYTPFDHDFNVEMVKTDYHSGEKIPSGNVRIYTDEKLRVVLEGSSNGVTIPVVLHTSVDSRMISNMDYISDSMKKKVMSIDLCDTKLQNFARSISDISYILNPLYGLHFTFDSFRHGAKYYDNNNNNYNGGQYNGGSGRGQSSDIGYEGSNKMNSTSNAYNIDEDDDGEI